MIYRRKRFLQKEECFITCFKLFLKFVFKHNFDLDSLTVQTIYLALFFIQITSEWKDFVVTTSDGRACDFSSWYGETPEYGNTCVRKYKSSNGYWWTSPYPWCYRSDGSWDYCQC